MTISDSEHDRRDVLAAAPAPGGTAGHHAIRAGKTEAGLPGWTLIISPAVTLAVVLWGAGAPGYSGDEMDTVSAVSRSVPQLIRMLGHFDGVHGFYYLLVWPWARIAGTSQFAMRFPSALAMAAAAAGITAIARRLGSHRAGLCAGLIFAVLPSVSAEGQDARPYALVTAAAVLATYLLVRAVQDPRPVWFAGYGLAVVLTGYIQIFGLLVVLAHAVALAGLVRWRSPETAGAGAPPGMVARRWLITLTAAGVALMPMVAVSWVQRGEFTWIPKPGWYDAWNLVSFFTANSAPPAVAIMALAVLGAIYGGAVARLPGRGAFTSLRSLDRRLTWVAAPWMVLPPLVLLGVSEFKPVYFGRYVSFCLPALALLAGAGVAAFRLPVRAAALALVAGLVTPQLLTIRAPGGGIEAVSEFLSAHEQPGDAIVYPAADVPPWYIAYPAAFSRLRDLSLAETPAAAGRLYGEGVPVPVLLQRERGVDRIWIPAISWNPASVLAPGFHLAHKWDVSGQVMLLYTRAGGGG